VSPRRAAADDALRICGRVVSAADGEPVAGASLLLAGSGIGAVSDADGGFCLEGVVAGRHRLRVQHVAFLEPEAVEVSVRAGEVVAPLRLELRPRVFQAPPVVVEARRERWREGDPLPAAGAPPREAGELVWRLDGEEARARGARNLAELLQALPEVEVREPVAGGAVSVSIRGSGAERVLVLLDGEPINDPATGVADLRAVPVAAIERVEVRRGAMAAAFGPGAMGGVISVVTAAGSVAGSGDGGAALTTRLRGEVGAYGWRSLEGSVERQVGGAAGRGAGGRGSGGGSSLGLTARCSDFDGDSPVRRSGYPYARNPNGWREERFLRVALERHGGDAGGGGGSRGAEDAGRDEVGGAAGSGADAGSGAVRCRLAPGRMRASLSYLQSRGGVPGTLEFVTPTAHAARHELRGQGSLEWGSWEDGRALARLDFSVSQAEQEYRSAALQDGYPAFPVERDSWVRMLQGQAQWLWGRARVGGGGGRDGWAFPEGDAGQLPALGRWRLLLSAGERWFEDQDRLQPQRGVGERRQGIAGGDLGGRWLWGGEGAWEKRLQLGLRCDWNGAARSSGDSGDGASGGEPTPPDARSGGLYWQPRIGLELASPPAGSGSWKLGLAAARSVRLPTLNDLYWGGDLNVQGNPELRPERAVALDLFVEVTPAAAPEWQTTLRTWHSEVRDWIEWRAGPALQWRPVNLPRVRFSGWEWSLGWRPADSFEAAVGGSRQRAENRDRSDLNAFGRQLPYRAEYSAYGRARWRSARGDRLECTLRWRGKEPTTVANTVWIPAHLLLDLGSRWIVLRRSAWQTELGLRVTNLLDRYDPSVIDQLPPGREIRLFLEVAGR
jgi:outer membrane receptor protein involved in Fe transport